MPYERSKQALPSSSSSALDAVVVAGGPDSTSGSVHPAAPQPASLAPLLPIGVLPSKATLTTAGPLFAAHAVRAVPKLLALVVVLPLLLVDAPVLGRGLLHGALRASNGLTAAYLTYVASAILLSPVAGAAADALAPTPRRRRWLGLGLLAGVCALLLALVLLLHPPSATAATIPWPAIVGTLTAGVILAEMAAPVLMAELISLAPKASALETGMLSTQAVLAGLGAAVVLVTVPALIGASVTARGHAADLSAARYASIGGFALGTLGLLLYALAGQQHATPEAAAHDRTATASTALHALRAGPPVLPRFLLVRTLYNSGLRSAGYLGLVYIVRHLHNHASIGSTALTLALAAAFVGGLLGQGFLAAHATQQRRRLERSPNRRLTVSASGAGMAAARAMGAQAPPHRQQHQQQHVEFAAGADDAADTTPPLTQAPLLVWLAVLAIVFAAVPSEMQLDPRTGGTTLTPSREMGIVYILALLAGLGLGFLHAYERGVLFPLLWPRGPAGGGGDGGATSTTTTNINVGRLAGLLLASGASLEWAPTVLYAALTQRGAEAPIAALVPSFALALLVAVLFLIGDRLGLGEALASSSCCCCSCRRPGGPRRKEGDSAASGEPEPDGRPRLGASMSFFLLRALPSHLSMILESPAPSHVASSVVPPDGATEDAASPAAGSLQSEDWTPRTA